MADEQTKHITTETGDCVAWCAQCRIEHAARVAEERANQKGHTAAPWSLGDENNACCEVNAGPVRISLDRIDPLTGATVISREEMLANAHLVIAAPEMLAMLVKNEDFINDQYGISEDLVELRELIAKARGQR